MKEKVLKHYLHVLKDYPAKGRTVKRNPRRINFDVATASFLRNVNIQNQTSIDFIF